MRAGFSPGIAAMLALAATSGCSHAAPTSSENEPPPLPHQIWPGGRQDVPGSYIVTAPANGDQSIRQVFAQYGVELVRRLGKEEFELRLSRDPGLDALKRLAAASRGAITAVQPNFIYHIE